MEEGGDKLLSVVLEEEEEEEEEKDDDDEYIGFILSIPTDRTTGSMEQR